jgi:hypothetical protein
MGLTLKAGKPERQTALIIIEIGRAGPRVHHEAGMRPGSPREGGSEPSALVPLLYSKSWAALRKNPCQSKGLIARPEAFRREQSVGKRAGKGRWVQPQGDEPSSPLLRATSWLLEQ